MNNLLIIFIFFIGSYHLSSAQTNVYHPFPDSGAVWNCFATGPCFILPVFYSYSFVLDGDTIIGQYTYHKLSIPYDTSWSPETNCPPFFFPIGYIGGIRQDTVSRKVFFIDFSHSAEELLYDFTLQVGDSVKGLLASFPCAIVSEIDSVLCSDGWRKRWKYDSGNFTEAIEGIGTMNGLIETVCIILGGHGSTVQCFSQNGQTIYPDSSYHCNIIDGVIEFQSSTAGSDFQIQIIPNPASSELTISSKQYAIDQIEIYNILGEQIYSAVVANRQPLTVLPITIGSELFPSGIYFVKAVAGEKVLFSKVVKE